MEKLGVVDNGFLMAETREAPLHVGSLQIYKLPKGIDKAEFYAEIIETMSKLTSSTAPFNRRLHFGPLKLGTPSWVVDRDLDIQYHIRCSALPVPGTRDQLMTLISRLHSSLLDRSRPLWEFHLIEGLEKDKFAIYFKIHHACVDGVGGMQIMKNILSTSDKPHTAHPLGEAEAMAKPKTKSPKKSPQEVLTETFSKLTTVLPEMAKEFFNIGSEMAKIRQSDRELMYTAPKSIINVPITAQRRFATKSYALSKFKEVGKAFGCSINDVVLAVSGGAIHRYLKISNAIPKETLTAGVPSSVRTAESGGNAFTMLVAGLGTHLTDPVERIKFVRQSIQEGKKQQQKMSSEAIMGVNVLMGAPLMAGQMLRIPHYIKLAYNIVVSNVPASKELLYLNGAEMESFYAVSLIYDMQALNITVTSYVDSLDFGIIGCRTAVKDIDKFADLCDEEFEALKKAAKVK